eukprot:169318-Chlamydomonas_euryale.AAC.2
MFEAIKTNIAKEQAAAAAALGDRDRDGDDVAAAALPADAAEQPAALPHAGSADDAAKAATADVPSGGATMADYGLEDVDPTEEGYY